jgi:hypothetical protein
LPGQKPLSFSLVVFIFLRETEWKRQKA